MLGENKVEKEKVKGKERKRDFSGEWGWLHFWGGEREGIVRRI